MSIKSYEDELTPKIDDLEQQAVVLGNSNVAYRHIFNSVSDGVYILDQQYNLLDINHVLEKTFGSINDHPKCYEYLNNRKEPCPWCRNTEVFAGNSVQWLWHVPDSDRVYEVHETPLHDTERGMIKVTFFHDVTPQLRAEKETKKNRQLLESIVNNTSTVIYVKNKEGKYLLVNQQYEKLFLPKGDDIIGKGDSFIFPQEQVDQFQNNDRQVLESGKVLQCEEIVFHDDGLHTYLSTKFPIYDDDVVYAVCGISTDITSRVKAEEALRNEITAHQESLKKLEDKNIEIENANTALKVLLDQYKAAGKEVEEQVTINLKKHVFPYIDLLQHTVSSGNEKEYLEIIKAHLTSLTTSFTKKLSSPSFGLTQREILVADLIRQGKSTKDIAQLLGLAPRSIEAYRNSLRKKLNINQRKINLRQYLLSTFSREE